MESKKESKKSKSSCLVIVVMCLVFGGIGCCYNKEFNKINNANIQQINKLQDELEVQKMELQSLARTCGIPDSTIESSSTTGLVSEIKISLEKMKYFGRTLSNDDLEYVNDMLSNKPQIQNTVKDYDSFIKSITNTKE